MYKELKREKRKPDAQKRGTLDLITSLSARARASFVDTGSEGRRSLRRGYQDDDDELAPSSHRLRISTKNPSLPERILVRPI